jgi:hypothetical protein
LTIEKQLAISKIAAQQYPSLFLSSSISNVAFQHLIQRAESSEGEPMFNSYETACNSMKRFWVLRGTMSTKLTGARIFTKNVGRDLFQRNRGSRERYFPARATNGQHILY